MEKHYLLKDLEKMDCRSFGGNNCVLHQCMFSCVLSDEIKKAKERESVPPKKPDQ